MESSETNINYYAQDKDFKTLKSSNNFVNYSSEESNESLRNSNCRRLYVKCRTSSSNTEEKRHRPVEDKIKLKDYKEYVKSKADIPREHPAVRRSRNENNSFTINTMSVGKYVTEIFEDVGKQSKSASKRSNHCTKTKRSVTKNCNVKTKRKRKVKKRPKWKFDKLPIQDSSTSGRCKELDSSDGFPVHFGTYGSTNPFSKYYYSDDPKAYISSVQQRLAQKSVIINTAQYSTGAAPTCIDTKSNNDDKMKEKDTSFPNAESDAKFRGALACISKNSSQSSSGYTSTQPLGQEHGGVLPTFLSFQNYYENTHKCLSPPYRNGLQLNCSPFPFSRYTREFPACFNHSECSSAVYPTYTVTCKPAPRDPCSLPSDACCDPEASCKSRKYKLSKTKCAAPGVRYYCKPCDGPSQIVSNNFPGTPQSTGRQVFSPLVYKSSNHCLLSPCTERPSCALDISCPPCQMSCGQSTFNNDTYGGPHCDKVPMCQAFRKPACSDNRTFGGAPATSAPPCPPCDVSPPCSNDSPALEYCNEGDTSPRASLPCDPNPRMESRRPGASNYPPCNLLEYLKSGPFIHAPTPGGFSYNSSLCRGSPATGAPPCPPCGPSPPCSSDSPQLSDYYDCNPCGPCGPSVSCGPSGPCGSNPCGPFPCGPNPCGPFPCGPNPCGPNYCGPSPCGPSPCGPSPCGPSPCGPSPCGPNPCGLSPCGPFPCGSQGYNNQSFSGAPGTGAPPCPPCGPSPPCSSDSPRFSENYGCGASGSRGANPCGPFICGPNPCGPNPCGPFSRGPNICVPNPYGFSCGPNPCGPFPCGPNPCGMSPCGPFPRGPNSCGPNPCGPFPCGPNPCGPFACGPNPCGPPGCNTQSCSGAPGTGGPPCPPCGTSPPCNSDSPRFSECYGCGTNPYCSSPCGPSPCGPSPCGPSPCGPSPCGSSPCGPSPCGPNPFSCGPGPYSFTQCGPGPCGPSPRGPAGCNTQSINGAPGTSAPPCPPCSIGPPCSSESPCLPDNYECSGSGPYGPSSCGPSPCGPNSYGPSPCGPSPCGPSPYGPNSGGPSPCGSNPGGLSPCSPSPFASPCMIASPCSVSPYAGFPGASGFHFNSIPFGGVKCQLNASENPNCYDNDMCKTLQCFKIVAYSKSSDECKSPSPQCCVKSADWFDPFKRPVITATCILERRRVSDIKTRAKRDENIQPNVIYYEMMPHPLNPCQELEVSYPVLCSTCDDNCKM